MIVTKNHHYQVSWDKGKSVTAVLTKTPVRNIIGREVLKSEFNAVMKVGKSHGLIFQREVSLWRPRSWHTLYDPHRKKREICQPSSFNYDDIVNNN